MEFREVDTRDLVLGNVAGELSMIGEALLDNTMLDLFAERVHPHDFVDALLGRIFATACSEWAAGRTVTAQTLIPFFQDDEDFQQRRGGEMLAQAWSRAVGHEDGGPFAAQIADLARRRRLIAGLRAATDLAGHVGNSVPVIVDAIEQAVNGLAPPDHDDQQQAAGFFAKRLIDSFGKPITGVRCGIISSLDDRLGTLERGTNNILAGRPGMGKTAVAVSYALGAAIRGHGVFIISLEMTGDELSGRMLADLCCYPDGAVPYEAIRQRNPSPDQLRRIVGAQQRLDELPIEIWAPGACTPNDLIRRVRRQRRKFEAEGRTLDLVVLDYLQLLQPPTDTGSLREHISRASIAVKGLAKDERCAFLTLAQLSRKPEERPDHRPIVSDLRESGQIEQDADSVTLLYREAEYLRQKEPQDRFSPEYGDWEGEMEKVRYQIHFDVAKARHGEKGRAEGLFFGLSQAVRGTDFYEMGGHPHG